MKYSKFTEFYLLEEKVNKRLEIVENMKKGINFILFFSFSWFSYLLWNMFFRSLVLVMSGIKLSSIRELKKISAHNSIELEIAADPLTFFFLSAIVVSIVPIYFLLKILKKYWLN
ncbi:hypothetical protein CMU38_10970 [Elizabethkingia anophelis]|nr:hypothetical protein [Elizabethkingia anophelis]